MDKYIFPLAIIAIIAIFAFDIMHPADIAIWLLYALPIVFAARSLSHFKIILLTVICTLLVLAGFLYFYTSTGFEISLTNRLLGVGIFWIILFLILELKKALVIVRRERDSLESKVQERTADLRRTDQLFRIATDATGAMIYSLDVKHRQITAIHGMTNLTGYEPDQIPLSYDWWRKQIHPDDLPAYTKEVDKTLEAKEGTHTFEYRFRCKKGEYIFIRNTAVLMWDKQGNLSYVVGTMLDVTKEKKYTARLEGLTSDLESFSYSISHDLRTPLSLVDGYVEMIIEDHRDVLNEDALHKFKLIQDSLDFMNQLILGVLALSRAERQELNRMELNMKAIAQAVIHELLQTADLKHYPEESSMICRPLKVTQSLSIRYSRISCQMP